MALFHEPHRNYFINYAKLYKYQCYISSEKVGNLGTWLLNCLLRRCNQNWLMLVLALLVLSSMEVLHLMSFLMVSHIYESYNITYQILTYSLDNSQNYKDLDIIFKLNSPDHGLYGPGSVQPNSIHPAQMRDGSVTCQSIRLDAHNRKKTNLNKKRKVIDECDNQRWTIIRVRTIIFTVIMKFSVIFWNITLIISDIDFWYDTYSKL